MKYAISRCQKRITTSATYVTTAGSSTHTNNQTHTIMNEDNIFTEWLKVLAATNGGLNSHLPVNDKDKPALTIIPKHKS